MSTSLRKLLCVVAMVVATLSGTVNAQEKALAEFKKLAQAEAPRLKQLFSARFNSKKDDPWGTSDIGDVEEFMAKGGRWEYSFYTGRFYGFEDGYSVDVKKTDSLVTPLIGIIDLRARWVFGTVFLLGEKSACHGKPMSGCLASGAQVLQKRRSAKLSFTTYRVRYLFQEEAWKLDKDSLDPGKAVVRLEKDEGQVVLPPEFVEYSVGLSDTRPTLP